MDSHTLDALNALNQGIIQFRGIYSLWSKQHDISYHEMLVLYTIRDSGFCTQKQICDNYLLPRQTIHNVIHAMWERGLLQPSPEHCVGREKAFVLTDAGRKYAQPLLDSLNAVEQQAVDHMGSEALRALTDLLSEYTSTLQAALQKQGDL